ncbi:MAG TPA: endonuclease/exonuclease/phosphatase family protein [Ktedonobacteraceae bacterium]|jgi:endonuclease/exonuclease/phosphatase family metal-dependent hydrolase
MTCIIAYNILAGGYNLRTKDVRRTHQLTKIISSVQPDIVGLVEALNPRMAEKPTVLEEIAQTLDMQLITSGKLARGQDYPIALLTRLPVVYSKVHFSPGLVSKPLLEVCVEEADGQQLTVFLTHLSAAFNHGWAGNHFRQREVKEILHIMAPLRAEGKPHVLMGDFNTLSPGDAFKASFLLRYVLELDVEYSAGRLADGLPYFNGIVPPHLRFLKPLLQAVAKSTALSGLFDIAANVYAPRGSIRPVRELYLDCFRHLHPHEWGFTCPAVAPAGRIDYIFACPVLADRLTNCYVITEGGGMPADHASDHLPVAAEFSLRRPG